jgi:hypothetical protein
MPANVRATRAEAEEIKEKIMEINGGETLTNVQM